MNIIHWGRGKNMAICVNGACAVYRQPVYYQYSSAPQAKTSAKTGAGKLEGQVLVID